jgi:hypothetical protein
VARPALAAAAAALLAAATAAAAAASFYTCAGCLCSFCQAELADMTSSVRFICFSTAGFICFSTAGGLQFQTARYTSCTTLHDGAHVRCISVVKLGSPPACVLVSRLCLRA